ncbi:hypothetical protein [Shewanella zhuhaiensis]|nr:hypothetical protein [Shewanella zhuhaiensis]
MEGFNAKSYSENPYPPDSHEFDEFERGRTQKIKRTHAGSIGLDVLDPSDFDSVPRLIKPKADQGYKYKKK